MKQIKSLKHAPQSIISLVQSNVAQILFGKASPESIKKLNQLLEKEINSYKDTEDYNFDLVSSLIDKTTKVWTEAGIGKLSPGDNITLKNKLAKELGVKDLSQDFDLAKKTGNYEDYIFSADLSNELRQYFLLRTSKDDKFKSLLAEMDSLIPQYMAADQWAILRKAIMDSQSRIFKNKLKFPRPLKGYEQNKVKTLTESDSLDYNLPMSTEYDERFDNHDLLAMKEMVNLLKGDVAHPLTIGPGFFAKYMPELKLIGRDDTQEFETDKTLNVYSGIIFHFHKNILKKIELNKLTKEYVYQYSPMIAGAQLYFSQLTKIVGKDMQVHLDKFGPEDRYFVVVDGCVGIPKSTLPYQNEFPSQNNDRVRAGETFVFEKKNEDVLCTRVYFTPYDYSKLHLMHQHGSVIFGTNEQSFQSCYRDATQFDEIMTNIYKDWWRDNNGGWDLATTAARISNKKLLQMGEGDPTNIFRPEYEALLKESVHSVSEVNDFTLMYEFITLNQISFIYLHTHDKNVWNLVKNYAPLSHRWLLKQYLEDEAGITKELQPTVFRKLAGDLKASKMSAYTDSIANIQKADQLSKKEGISFEEAYKRLTKGE